MIQSHTSKVITNHPIAHTSIIHTPIAHTLRKAQIQTRTIQFHTSDFKKSWGVICANPCSVYIIHFLPSMLPAVLLGHRAKLNIFSIRISIQKKNTKNN